jgi:hypothetical protein
LLKFHNELPSLDCRVSCGKAVHQSLGAFFDGLADPLGILSDAVEVALLRDVELGVEAGVVPTVGGSEGELDCNRPRSEQDSCLERDGGLPKALAKAVITSLSP